ncbi:MAG: ATP-binding protein [Anaerobutyricum soehngenii]
MPLYTSRQIVKYQNRISGSILDRMDLFVRCEEIGYDALTSISKEEMFCGYSERVSSIAWEIQKERFAKVLRMFNGTQ